MTSAGMILRQESSSPRVPPREAKGRRRRVFITWYPYCRRSDALAEQIGACSFLIHYLKFKVPALAPIKYLFQSFKTCLVLIRERPRVVLVASPPVVAPALIWLVSKILGYRYVIDAHSGMFQHSRWSWSEPIQRFLSRRAEVTVVTNAHMAEIVRSWGARAELVQDLSLDLRPSGPATEEASFHVVFICTYSVDEPVEAVVEAARKLLEVKFSFTGDPYYAPKALKKDLPANVRLTGFLPDEDYLALLRGADAILVLTREDHTMQRGGYEAVALGKPLIISDWPLLREVFSRGAIHVDNSATGIVRAVEAIREDPLTFRQEMVQLRRERGRLSAAQVTNLDRLCGQAEERSGK